MSGHYHPLYLAAGTHSIDEKKEEKKTYYECLQHVYHHFLFSQSRHVTLASFVWPQKDYRPYTRKEYYMYIYTYVSWTTPSKLD